MKYLYTLALLLIMIPTGVAKHIIGGVLTYECLGGGTYKFTMKMYRDCYDPTGAGFDQSAAFSIYKGSSTIDITTIYVSPNIVTDVDPPQIPCLELPDNVCVEEGIYEFEYTFADWPSDESYHISYQRCCRNATVVNIENPDDVGATFTVEIMPASQAFCNDSPVFNVFPPIVICVNEPLHYDHSAVDAEGDQLVYELCSPLLGGAPPGGGGGGGPCSVVAPNPACPPPYEEASFVNPPYSPLNPMGGDPAVTINPVTGVLTGTPNVTGQFVFAVCISEYRNGQLLSVIRRDFQFNVASCDPVLNASLTGTNLVLQNDSYYLETCNGPAISIENESTVQGGVDDIRWEFNSDDSTYVYDTWDLEVVFPGPGRYEGLLALNPGQPCGDTADIRVDIYPELISSFTYLYDTCVAGPVSFIDESYIDGNGQIENWVWDLGDGTIDSMHTNPVYKYGEPQTVLVKLEVTDENGCTDDTMRTVVYKPVPGLILVRPNDTLSCPPASVFFNNLSNPIDQSYTVEWDFGDGGNSNAISPTHVFEQSGVYDIRLQITSPIGCYADTTFVGLIELLEPPLADFDFLPTTPSNIDPLVEFSDLSVDAVHWDWYINDDLISQDSDFMYSFPDTGLQEVILVVTHAENCQDTMVRLVDVEPRVTFHLPNAFTPNEDTNNDLFKGTGVMPGITDYTMVVWDRWGEKIFETDDPGEAWNGRFNNNGRSVQTGVYVCVVSFTGPRGKPFEFKGYATLLR